MGNQPSTTVFQVGYIGVEHARGGAENRITASCSQSRRTTICTSTRLSCCSCLVALSARTAGFESAISWPPTTRDNQSSSRSDRVIAFSSRCGSRTQPTRLERPMTSPEVERATLCALVGAKWAGRCSNPRLRFFRPPVHGGARVSATSSSCRPSTKKPGVTCTCDTGSN